VKLRSCRNICDGFTWRRVERGASVRGSGYLCKGGRRAGRCDHGPLSSHFSTGGGGAGQLGGLWEAGCGLLAAGASGDETMHASCDGEEGS
jgi:hypothetical protein